MKLSRKVIFMGTTVVFIILAAVFFGVFLKRGSDNGPTDSTVTTESTVTTDSSLPADSVVVAIRDGKIAGEWIDAAQGHGYKFAAFRGIPYARPPVGDLRFKGPKPPAKWDNVLLTTKEGSQCCQHATEGSEDCLYLNVYTPKLPTEAANPKLAVYFFIHGGAFKDGNANMDSFGPDFLIQHDIVVVTMTYRTNILASLSLDTDDVPGNAGLKDQLQALRWVHDNIAVFGGDPTKVTIGGHSSGAVSAHWLSMLPQTKNLIRSAIIQSGPAVSGWGYTDKNIEFAKAIYKHLTGNQTDDLSEISNVVKAVPYVDLWYAAENATALLQKEESIGSAITYYYMPYIERRTEGTEEILIARDSESYAIDGNDFPMMLGEAKNEWTLFYSFQSFFDNETKLDALIENIQTYVPNSILPGPDTKKYLKINDTLVTPAMEETFLAELRDFYFTKYADESCNTNCRMAKYMTQAYILVDTSRTLRVRSKYSTQPTYAFQFNLKSDYNTDLSNLPEYLRHDVVHGDDQSYVWYKANLKQDYNADTVASRAVRRMVTMTANFVKYGNPTPQTDDLIDVAWQPVSQGDPETFLEITENLTQRAASLAGDSTPLWIKIFSEYRGGSSP